MQEMNSLVPYAGRKPSKNFPSSPSPGHYSSDIDHEVDEGKKLLNNIKHFFKCRFGKFKIFDDN